jgi:NADPH:quinone reductase-like Zn-dependent oxidoreductase
MPNMKEAIVHKGVTVEIVDSPVPSPNADQVLIKVVVSGTNPKDWYALSNLYSLRKEAS